MKPLGYYVSATASHPDADLLDRISEEFGSLLQELSRDDKATLVVCLTEKAEDPAQVLIEYRFFSDANAGNLWQLAQKLSPSSQLQLSLAILNQLIAEG